MVRGIHKSMIQIKTPDSRLFDEAYFVLRVEPHPKPISERDMTREAHRILEDGNLVGTAKRRSGTGMPRRRSFAFFCGLLCGASLVALIWLTVLLLL